MIKLKNIGNHFCSAIYILQNITIKKYYYISRNKLILINIYTGLFSNTYGLFLTEYNLVTKLKNREFWNLFYLGRKLLYNEI